MALASIVDIAAYIFLIVAAVLFTLLAIPTSAANITTENRPAQYLIGSSREALHLAASVCLLLGFGSLAVSRFALRA